MTIRAIYENGVFTPTDKVDLPEKAEVVFEPRVVEPREPASAAPMAGVYAILSRRYDTEKPDLAERHNEHQP